MKPQLNAFHLILFTALLSLLLIMSCGESIQNIDHPELPRHSLQINGNVQFQAAIHWIDSTQSLETKIRAVNASNDTIVIETGPCSFQILAYRSTDTGNELIWHNQMPESTVCFDELLVYQIPPSDSLALDQQQYISGNRWKQPIPKGEWEFVVRVKSESDEVIRISAGRVKIK